MANATQERETKNVEVRQETNNRAEQHTNNSNNGNDLKLHEQTSVEQTGKQEVATPQGVERTRTGRVYIPAVDIYETSDSVMLVADMPGVDESSLDVSLEKNVLTIYGRVEPQVPAGHSLAYSEYRIGDFQRSFTISNAIDWERIEGVVKNGVLRLTLPKAGPATTKKINIKSA
jgi:HSP20 family molecular chaperone IbpA